MDFGTSCEIRLVVFPGFDAADETLKHGWCGRALEGFPLGRPNILAEADLEIGPAFVQIDFKSPLGAVNAEEDGIGFAGSKAGGVDHADTAGF